jgi:hypothetical protein
MDSHIFYCNNVVELRRVLGQEYKPENWWFFRVKSKAVPLHNRKDLLSIPIGHAVHMKFSYENMKLLPTFTQYNKHFWNTCSDFEVTALVLGLQLRYAKRCCSLPEQDNCASDSYYAVREWPHSIYFLSGQKNIANGPHKLQQIYV